MFKKCSKTPIILHFEICEVKHKEIFCSTVYDMSIAVIFIAQFNKAPF